MTADGRLSRVATLFRKRNQPNLFEESLHALCFSPDGRMLAGRLAGDRTAVWETGSGAARLSLDTHGPALAFAPDGRSLAAVSRSGLVQHWNLATRQRADTPREDFLFVCNAVASADGKTVALTDHHSVLLKVTQTGKTVRRFDDVGAEYFALSADGRMLAVADQGVRLWDADRDGEGAAGEAKASGVRIGLLPGRKVPGGGRGPCGRGVAGH